MLSPLSFNLLTLLAYMVMQSHSAACSAPTPYSYNSNCYPQCPWNSTLVTYLDGTICKTSCPSGSYADDSTKKCAATCPSAPIQTYKDTIYNRCVEECSTSPSYFAYNVTNTCVQYCPSPYWAYEDYQFCVLDCPLDTYFQVNGTERTCVKICYPNYYAHANRTCVQAINCSSATVDYYGDDSTGKCVKVCPVAQGTYGDNSTRRCVIYCPLGSFADPTTQICLAICPSVPYYYGSNITRNCLLSCNEGEFADNTTRQCVLKCPSGYYGDYYTRTCVKTCPVSRATFADKLSNLCVPICPANYYADNNTRSCQAGINCTNQTFGDPVTQKCVSAQGCSPGFYVDASKGLCVVRCSTWGNPLTMLCQPSCPWNPPIYAYYKDPSTNRCVQLCPRQPRTFGDNSTQTCVSVCPSPSLGNPVNMVCQQTCPSGFFADATLNICVATCTQNTSLVLYFYSLNLTCGSACPKGYYADNATLTCELRCTNNTFGYQPNNTCLSTCPAGYFGDNYTLTCLTSCPNQNGQYADPSTHLCVTMCPQNPDYYGQDINNGNRSCVLACSVTGFFADPLTRICVPKCDTSFGLYGYPSDWRCYERCPTGFGSPLNSQCVGVCPRSPKFFYGDNLTQTCVLSCPNQTYGDPQNNLCVNATDCSAGTFADDASGLCVPVCSQLLKLFGDPLNGKCVSVCTYPLYANDITQKCQVDCSSSASRYMQNASRSCVEQCSSVPDRYGDPNSHSCEYNCTNGYFALANSTRRVCVSMCPSTPAYLADLDNMVCVLACANETYQFINNTFRGCLKVCPAQIYNSSLSDDLYADNTTWKCVQFCPYGFYAFKHPSNSSIRLCVRICPMVNSQTYFAQEKSRKCVVSCPMMAYGTYGDIINFKCVSTCSRLQYRDNSTGLCVYACQPGFFANNVTWNCSAWCNTGYFAESINRTCVKNCPFGYYGHNLQCVAQCPNNTLYYNDNTTWLCVTRCPAYPDYYADNSSQSCVLRCGSNSYADSTTRSCLPALNCSDTTIADPISGRCTLKCTKEPMYYLTPQTNTCGPTCANSSFAFNQTNLCVDECPSPYFGVNTTNPSTHFYCVQYCPPHEYMWVNFTTRMCIPLCPAGLFRDNMTMSCVQVCPDYYYANASNLECVLTCAPLYADDQTKSCVEVCPAGKTASNHSFLCQDYCDFGEFALQGVCVTDCPNPTFADNLTRACISGCPGDPLTFADPVNRRCVLTCNSTEYAFTQNLTCLAVCPQGYYRQLTLRLCLTYCPEGYFADNLTLNCLLSCSNSNYPYADPTTQFCVKKCPSSPDLYGYSNQCLTQCPSGLFAQNVTRTCVPICPNASSTYVNASWADPLTRRCLKRCSTLLYAFSNSSDNVCIQICPVGSWASIAEQACLLQCPNNTYAHNTTTTCVEQCPPGQYADLVNRVCMPNCTYNSSMYQDYSSDSCVSICPSFPDLYADDSTQKCVLSCPNNTYAYSVNRKCLLDCPSPYYADPYSLQCLLKCPIETLTYADDNLRKCVPTCSNYTINGTFTMFYADNATLKCIPQCPNLPNRFYGFNTSNVCLQKCPTGTFGDNDTRLCLDRCIFKSPKFTWMDLNNNFCVTVCPYGYYADNKTGFCNLTCTVGTFADDSTRRCVYDCPFNPTSFSVISGGTGICVYNCPPGTYSSEVSISCVTTCPKQPSIYYTYPPTNACVKQCIYPYYADTQTQACTQQCKVGFYGNLTTKTCQICQIQCVTCTGYLVCTSCITGFYLYQITCVVSCPTYPVLYFAHKQSGVCFITCPPPFFGESTTKLCQLSCPTLTYPSLTTRICTACPAGCITCDASGCYTCFSNYTFLLSALTCMKNCNATAKYYFNKTCFRACPAGSYLSYDLVNCLACSSPCATCVGTAGNCTSCIGSYYYLGKCLSACPDNFFVDSALSCQPCSSNPAKCTLPPLNYTIYPFTKNYKLNAYCVFNRAVNISVSVFTSTVQINYAGKPVKSSQYNASVFNSTTFLVIFTGLSGSLNQNALSFYFPPGSIADQYGNVLTTVTVESNVAITTGVTQQVATINAPVTSSTQIMSYCLLALLALFFVKSGYPALITIEIVQLIYMHIFLFTDPLPFIEYNFLDVLKYFHFTFLPKLFSPLGITNTAYSLFSSDMSYLSNSPCILLFSFVIAAYLLVGFLSSKRFISNKSIRKLFKSIRKNRMKYSIIHDAFWVCYLYAMFISMLQFKIGSFSGSANLLNMLLAISTFLIFLGFTLYIFRLGYKYRKEPEKIPKKFAFLMLQPSASPLEMPMRYARKLIFCLGLLLTTVQTQGLVLLASNILFLSFYACYRPAKAPLTNKICIALEIGLILLISLFISYDKLNTKDISAQLGFSIAMIVVQALMMITVLLWSFYRLILVIRQTETWKAIYNKLTQNKDPEYLREQQRKRDLQFDFGSLENRSQDEKTEQVIDKQTAKSIEKFNIFDQQDKEQEANQNFDLEKPLKPASTKKLSRPGSVDSNEAIILKSQTSKNQSIFEPHKSAENYRRRKHLQILHKNKDNSIEQLSMSQKDNKPKQPEQTKQAPKLAEQKSSKRVLWEQLDIDDDEY